MTFVNRIVVSLAAGLVLYLAGTLGRLERWPTNNVIARLGLTSYSLFLVHFPIIVIIRALWSQLGGSSLSSMIVATVLAYVVSLLVAEAFYRVVELPALERAADFHDDFFSPVISPPGRPVDPIEMFYGCRKITCRQMPREMQSDQIHWSEE